MNLLTIENLTKSYTEKRLFDSTSFSINSGEKVGIIGINGTGKSTLLKIIAGVERSDEGNLTKANNIVIKYLPQNPILDENSTILDIVVNANRTKENEWTIESEAKTILNKLGITEYDKIVENLSGGEKKRIALAATVLSSADILILDEPTNHLDYEMVSWLEGFLIQWKGALIMVTHDRYFLDRVVNRIVEIDKGNIYSYNTNYEGFLTLKSERESMEVASERKRQSILRKELEWIKRGARARSTKQKSRIERYEDMKAKNAPVKDGTVQLDSISSRLGKTTIELENITKSFDGRTIINDFSYIFLKEDRVGFIGRNGAGKSTLMRLITGEIEPDSGKITIGETVKIGYFSQENEYMDINLRVIDYIREIADYVKTTDGMITASQMLERFLFTGEMQYTQISRLSGGERRRLYLLRVLMGAPNVLILDEPTNDLDINTMTILEDYLDSFDGIVITVSHDRYFLDRIARRIFDFEENGIIRQYEGGFSDYEQIAAFNKEKLLEVESEQNSMKKSQIKSNKDNNNRQQNRKLKFSYNEQREYDTIEEDIAKVEEKIDQLDNEIAINSTNYGKLNELMAQKEEQEKILEQYMDRWAYLEDLNEQIKNQ